MKKLSLIVLSLFIVFCCCACDGDVTREIRHAGFNVGGKFICNPFYPENEEDTTYQRIRYFTGSHVINTEGVIYELSLGKTFANKQNCKLADTSLRVKAIMDDKIVKGTDNKYYYLIGQNNVASYSEIPETDNSYVIYDLLLRDDDVIKVTTADNSAGLYYILKTDGNIYGNVINRVDRNSPPVVISTQIVYSRSDYGASILDYHYAGDSVTTFVRTEDKVFRMKITNIEECGKYADIPCRYAIQEDPLFVDYRDRIITFNGSTLITDYKQIFSVAS